MAYDPADLYGRSTAQALEASLKQLGVLHVDDRHYTVRLEGTIAQEEWARILKLASRGRTINDDRRR